MLIPTGASGVDFSAARPDPQLLVDRGLKFVCRYVGSEQASLRWKATTRPELQGLWDHGIGVVLNGETSKDAALLGALRGSIDALIYVTAARNLGAPPGTTIVISHDTSAWSDQVPLYCRAAYDVIIGAGFTFGVYGSGKVVQDCLDRGMILTIIWATASWAWPGGIHALAHIRQGTQVTLGGGLVDMNACKRPFEAWHPNSPKPPVVVAPVPPVVVVPAPPNPLPVTPPVTNAPQEAETMLVFAGPTDEHPEGNGVYLLHHGRLVELSSMETVHNAHGLPSLGTEEKGIPFSEVQRLQERFPDQRSHGKS